MDERVHFFRASGDDPPSSGLASYLLAGADIPTGSGHTLGGGGATVQLWRAARLFQIQL
jgi:hypothetical protein